MLAEKFAVILKKEKEEELVPFLKSLEKDDKKKVGTALKGLWKEYLEYKQVSSIVGSSFKQKATPLQSKMLYATAFTCLTRKEYEKFDAAYNFLTNEILSEQIFPWYCPVWFNDLINDLTKREWMPWAFRYENAITFWEKGYLTPSDELVARLIPDLIFERDAKHQFTWVPHNLVKRQITCQHHIWLIFQYETTINHSDRYLNFKEGNTTVEHRWLHTLKQYTDNGKLERKRMLQESIQATNRNFNKVLAGWFVDLFEYLEPSHPELLVLQPELLNALSAQNSKAVNASLNALKKIVGEKDFDAKGLLEHTPLLFASETKSVVTAGLILLEKMLKHYPFLKEEICLVMCQAFIQQDEAIQGKVCKLLLKHHDTASLAVTTEISKYADSMLMSSKKALTSFLSENPPQAVHVAEREAIPDKIFIPLPEIETLDELIFLASQAFDNNDPLHIDLLPAALVNLQDQITGSSLSKFEPALQRAYQMVTNDWPSTMGYLDHLLATFFIDCTKIFIKRFRSEGASLTQIHTDFKRKEEEKASKWKWYENRILAFNTWSVNSKDNTYILHKAILLNAHMKLTAQEQLPILSTPTHQHGYIDPIVLVKRIALCARANVLSDNYDFQIALSRIAPFHHEEALQEARESLSGEILRILEFLLQKDARPVPPFTTSSLWFMAGITKAPLQTYPEFSAFFYSSLPKSLYTGDVPWRSFVEHYKTTRYNFEKKRNEEIPAQHNVLRLTLNPPARIWSNDKGDEGNILSKFITLITSSDKRKKEDIHILYEFFSLKAQFLSAEHNDVQRFLYLVPSNPNPVLALVSSKSLVHSTFSSETDKKLVTNTLEALIHLTFEFSEMTHLFVATCLLTSDKTVRSFAAELWIQSVNAGTVDSAQLGRIVGTHQIAEYAPLKRFTDLISSNLLQISPLHNKALEIFLTSMLEQLSDETPTGMKRLLELYSEVRSLNNSSGMSEPLKQKLQVWSSSASLKKAISSLL